MKKRSERHKKKSYLTKAILICSIILIISGLGYYLEGIINFNMQKVKSNNANIKTNDEISKLTEENTMKEPIKKEVVISFAGDFTLGTDTKFAYDGSLPAAFINSGKNYSYFMQNVSSIFNNDDYTLVNLETTLTDSNIKTIKEGDRYYNFKGSREYAKILTNASIDGVTIANNHIYDYGTQGIKDTINTLKENDIDICGEGYKILKEIKGIKFGFLGYTGWQYSNELKEKIINDISDLRSNGAAVVIPYFHWGIERMYEPDNVQQRLARFSIDNGADAVIGSHPHVIQSMESYKGKLIAYSMANFCFGGNSNPSDKRTFILQMKANIENDKLINFEYKIIPAMISSRSDKNDYVPTLATGKNRVDILQMLNKLSPSLNDSIEDQFFFIK